MGHAAYHRKALDVYFPTIPIKRGKPPANRELHVVAGVIIFPTHPGPHVNLQQVGKTLRTKAAVQKKNAPNLRPIFPCFLSVFARVFDLAPDVGFRRSWYRRKARAAYFCKVLDLWETELRTERYGPANRGRPEHFWSIAGHFSGEDSDIAPDVGFRRSWCRRKACATYFLKWTPVRSETAWSNLSQTWSTLVKLGQLWSNLVREMCPRNLLLRLFDVVSPRRNQAGLVRAASFCMSTPEKISGDDMLIAGSSIEEINNLKKQLSKQFAMKDLGPAKQILGMRIIRDRANGTLKLSQTEYVKKILSRFSMDEAKSVSTPLGSHFRLTKDQSPKTEQEQAYMSKVPYASAIGSLMYAMVCTRPDIAHAVGVVSRYMSNPRKAALGGSQVDSKVSKRYFRHISLLHRS
uniref:Reverse transcriptase Ty1/copia-type domain-containing protein n=1 Tax=Fagus sylvatica TaxID=28930 RepID=A0A2N9ELN6_FAGSY